MSAKCLLCVTVLVSFAILDVLSLPTVAKKVTQNCVDERKNVLIDVALERKWGQEGKDEKVRYRCVNPENYEENGQLKEGTEQCNCPPSAVCKVDATVMNSEGDTPDDVASEAESYEMVGYVCKPKAQEKLLEDIKKEFSSGLLLVSNENPEDEQGEDGGE